LQLSGTERIIPAPTVGTAAAFAERAWTGFVDMALDFLAVRAAIAEQEAAPRN